MFQVGHRVVCTNDNFSQCIWELANDVPVCGRIYTVRKVTRGAHWATKVYGPAITLVEIVNPPTNSSGGEVCFSTWRFRPLEEVEAQDSAENEDLVEDALPLAPTRSSV